MVKSLSDLFVLLVEPSSTQSRIIREQLAKLSLSGYQCLGSGADAIAACRADPPDLVISALYLKDMTGSALLRKLKMHPDTREIAFMLVSSETAWERLEPVRQAGASAILPKPFDAGQLKRALYTCIESLKPERLVLQEHDVEDLEVLVVDDSRLARRMISTTLRKMGIERIMEANDGAQAIPLIEEHFFDLVVTDYNMPEMDGGALLDHIRQRSKQRSVPVLMVTTENDVGKLAAVEQAGVSAICDKPFEPKTVRALIEQALAPA